MLEIPEGEEHTVYLLGAGFSAEQGIPMMDGFVTRMIEANGWLRNENRTAESDDIINLLNYRQDISSAALRCVIRPDNIEGSIFWIITIFFKLLIHRHIIVLRLFHMQRRNLSEN